MKHVIEEIGSEFWIEDVIAVINDGVRQCFRENGFNGDNRLLLSGRTAIDFLWSKYHHGLYAGLLLRFHDISF